MAKHTVDIITKDQVTHDVVQLRTSKPKDYAFHPGQATELAILKNGWANEPRPFTFTSLPEDNYLEFTIKIYPEHNGVTNQMTQLSPDDELQIGDAWGAVTYRGKGTFIAGGAGVTPFLSIFRKLRKENQLEGNKLIFANKTEADIIQQDELHKMLGDNFINILSDEENPNYSHGLITEDFLRAQIKNFDKIFYLCGPPPMMKGVEKALSFLSVSKDLIVKEEF